MNPTDKENTTPEGEVEKKELEESNSPAPDATTEESPKEDATQKEEIAKKDESDTSKEDKDEDLQDDSEPIPDAEEEDEIDWDKQASEPKTIHQARSLRKENMNIKKAYKKLKAENDTLKKANEDRVKADEIRAAEEALTSKKKEVVKKHGLSEEDVSLFTGTDETVWETLAKRLATTSERITQNELAGPKGVKADQPDGPSLYKRYTY
jgi:hypothetical protein